MKYKEYDILDFLSDDFFIQWVKKPEHNNRHFWEKWLQQHPEKREIVLEAASIIRSVKYANSPELSDEMYVDAFETIIKTGNQKRGNESESKSLFSFYFLRNIAAVLLFGFCGWMGYYHMLVGIQQDIQMVIEEATVSRNAPAGKRSIITLADSSRIFLNAESEIEYPAAFNQGEIRWVRLSGEAFFEVRKNGKPFSVFANNMEIKVLGTSFNVKDEEKDLSVALVSGKVQVKDRRGNQIRLEPLEMLAIKEDGKLFKTGFDTLEVTGWKDRILFFKTDSFEDVKQKIEKWYDVDLTLEGKVSRQWKYSGVYKEETLENVLRGIFITSGMRFNIDKRKVTLYNPK